MPTNERRTGLRRFVTGWPRFESRKTETPAPLLSHLPPKDEPSPPDIRIAVVETQPDQSRGWIDYAAWLSRDVLLLVGWCHIDEAEQAQATFVLDGHAVAGSVRWTSFPRPDVPGDDRAGKLIAVKCQPRAVTEPLNRVALRIGAENRPFGPADLHKKVTDLPAFLRGGLAWLDADSRRLMLDFLCSIAAGDDMTAAASSVSRNLHVIREALRERLPAAVIASASPQGLHIDTLLRIDERSFYVRGWVCDIEDPVTELQALSPEGARADLFSQAFWYARPDVIQFYGSAAAAQRRSTGFISFFTLPIGSRLTSGWIFQMRNAYGIGVEINGPDVVNDPVAVRTAILGDLALHDQTAKGRLLRSQVHPALSRFQDRWRETAEIDEVTDYGDPVERPDVSIIVPLYQRIDFLEHQLAQFVHDPEIYRAELIYVLDSPELAPALTQLATQLFRLYRVPFRVVTLVRNAGFSGANNLGASVARGRLLLLLNSDVLPDKPGWLRKLVSHYDSIPAVGALGPKLLYEDDSLQHAGMYFSRPSGASAWENQHWFKGLHRDLPAANIRREVPAVTAACLMIDRALFATMGGLRANYLQGDYEDSDLCLRLAEAGYQSWYVPDVELYHLEGQSYSTGLRRSTSEYNVWLHTKLWDERIAEIMARFTQSAALLAQPDAAAPARYEAV